MPLTIETIKPEIRRSVTSIFVTTAESAGQPVPIGTGFFVFIERASRPTRQVWQFLITAKHVVLNESGELESPLWIRLNTKVGPAEFVRIDEDVEASRPYSIFFPDDPRVDLVALVIQPDASHFEFASLKAAALIGPRERYGRTVVGEGSEVFYPGLFASVPGVTRNQPIVRFGRISLLSEERIPWKGEMLELHLVETHAYGGTSGAPVFVGIAGRNVSLLGVMKGHFLEPGPIRFEGKDLPADEMNAGVNQGIAGVVPAYLLHEFLYGTVLPKLTSGSSTSGEGTVDPRGPKGK